MLAFKFRALFFLVSILTSCTFAIPTPRPSVVHEEIQQPPKGFVSNGPAADDITLEFHLALTSNNASGLEKALYDVSTPNSPNYGNYLSKSEVASYIAPSAKTTSAVQKWLKANGIQATNVSSTGDWIKMTVNVSTANALFDTRFEKYTHEPTGQETIRTLKYSLPDELVNHIDVVHPMTGFPLQSKGNTLMSKATLSRRKAVSRSSSSRATQRRSLSPDTPDPSVCNSTEIEPACIQALYGLPPSVGPQTESRIGVTGFLNEFAQKSDFALFLKEFRPDLSSNTTFSVETLDGGDHLGNSPDDDVEANLDIQYTAGLAGNVPTTFISVGADVHDNADLGGFLDVLNFLMEQDDPPQVLTTSYGQNEITMPASFSRKFCNTAAAVGARGVSLLYASGDGGVGGVQSPVPPDACTTFRATFPAGCPYITSVGATQFLGPETAAEFSSGGFSDIYSMPPYQQDAVNTYLKQLGQTYEGLYNKNGRAYPDVATVGVNVTIIAEGEVDTVDGTSCSSPIFAALIGEVNAMRLQAGKKVLGFLNPVLYANPDLFHDITNGSNPGCGTDGFPTTTGWDPVTGMGSPNFQKFLELP